MNESVFLSGASLKSSFVRELFAFSSSPMALTPSFPMFVSLRCLVVSE